MSVSLQAAAKKMVLIRIYVLVLLVLLSCSSIGQAEYSKYKDAQQPLNVRIRDLMDKMSLAEKIGQMTQIERLVASPDVMEQYYIGLSVCLSVCLFILFYTASVYG